MEKGTGALKVTPAHDFNDFKIGKKLKILFMKYLINLESLMIMFPLSIKVRIDCLLEMILLLI